MATFTIGGNLDINGTSGAGCVWSAVDIDFDGGGGTYTASYCTVSNSTVTDGPVDATDHCTDSGGNSGWTFGSFVYARPDADVSDGDWLPSTGADLYACIDETTYSDTDYIYTTSLSACTVALGNVNDPGSSDNHTVRYRAKGDGSTDLVVTLKQGSTTIATWTETNASSTMTAYSHTLTSGEADSITDYTDLRLTFEAQ